MRELSVPRGRSDVDAAWMTALLRAVGLLGSDAEVASIALEPPQSQGNTGGALRARLRYTQVSTKSPESLIVKLVPESAEGRRLMRDAGVARAEVGLYRELAPQLPIATPRAGVGLSSAAAADMTGGGARRRACRMCAWARVRASWWEARTMAS